MPIQKQCVPDALAGAPGTSPEDEGADRPTPHTLTLAETGSCRNRRRCVFVWRDGTLQVPTEQFALSFLQFALLAGASPRHAA
jgi:hypothetical protein